jgi:transposase-like protein
MMSETFDPVPNEVDQRQLAEQLLAQAKEQGVELVGRDGLLNQLTKNVLETALDAEMTEHRAMTSMTRPGAAAAARQRHQAQDRTHRDRPGRNRGAPRHELLV